MPRINWTNALIVITAVSMMGCQSSIQQVLPQEGKTMKTVYQDFAGDSGTIDTGNGLQTHARAADAPLSLYPPQARQIEHLYPKIDNPDLFMYVRPHAVGASGAPIPAYITRFSLYRSSHYALPNETSQTVPAHRALK